MWTREIYVVLSVFVGNIIQDCDTTRETGAAHSTRRTNDLDSLPFL
jgi:hypothetical protein